MVSLNFNVEGQHLTKTSEDYLANKSMNILKIKIGFDDSWEGFTKYAIFSFKGEHYMSCPVYNDSKYEFTVPTEVLNGDGFYFTLVGYISEADEIVTRLTTNKAYVKLNGSGFTSKLKNGHFDEVDEDAIASLFSIFYTKAEIDGMIGDCEDLLGGS